MIDEPSVNSPPDAEHNRLTELIIGALIEVHRHLGPGFQESIYEEALARELTSRGIAFARQVPFVVLYKGDSVGTGKIDFVVEGNVIVELKACESFAPI